MSKVKHMKSVFALALAAFFLSANPRLLAQKLTPELLWQLGRVGLDCVSPDGRLAVYGVQRYDLKSNKGSRALYAVNLQTGETRQLTDAAKTSGDAEFRPDGKVVGFLQDGLLHEIAPDGTGLRKVSDVDMNGFHYAPNGRQILFTRDVKHDKSPTDLHSDLPMTSGRAFDGLFYRHWKSWHDYKYSNVFVASYSAGSVGSDMKNIMDEPYDSPLQPDGGMEQITWSPDSRFIVYTCRKLNGTAEAQSTNSDLYAYDVAAGKAVNLTGDLPGYDLNPTFSPDGKYLAWTSMEHPGNEADRPRLMLLEVATSQRRELTEGWQYEANDPQWAPDSKSIYFLSSTDFTYHPYNIGVGGGKPRRVTEGQFDYSAMKVAGEQLVATRTSMANPAEVFVINPKTGDAKPVTQVNQATWGSLTKGRVERRTMKATDGKNLNVWVIYPPDFDAKKKYPALLYCQGGPQSPLSQGFSYRWNFQLMAANGYIVIAPCRRGMPGSGQSWNDEIAGDWGGQAMRDLLTATDEMSKEPFVDKSRLGAVGASFGGFAVYWLAGNHQKRFIAFISHCGVFNFESFLGTTEELWFPGHDLPGNYWTKPQPETWQRDNPIRYVQNWDTPILVIHNELDFRVPFGEGMQAFQAAQLRGVPSRFLSFPDEGHWMSKPQNSILWQREFFGWLDKWLK